MPVRITKFTVSSAFCRFESHLPHQTNGVGDRDFQDEPSPRRGPRGEASWLWAQREGAKPLGALRRFKAAWCVCFDHCARGDRRRAGWGAWYDPVMTQRHDTPDFEMAFRRRDESFARWRDEDGNPDSVASETARVAYVAAVNEVSELR